MLAIVIPYYKLTYFRDTLDSIANQKDKRFNVYIGDDASSEDCTTLLSQYKNRIKYTYKRFENNLGKISLVKHWERCVAMSNKEEWLMILGDDDILESNVILEFYKNLGYINELKINVVRCASQIIFEKNSTVSDTIYHPKLESIPSFFFRKFSGKTRSSLSEYFFRKLSYNKFGFTDYPLGWHSDDKAWLDFSEGNQIYTINNVCIKIRISESSITGNVMLKEKKINAEVRFYSEMIFEYLDMFSKRTKHIFLKKYEVTLKNNNNLTFWLFFKLCKKYIEIKHVVGLFKFLRRMYIYKFITTTNENHLKDF